MKPACDAPAETALLRRYGVSGFEDVLVTRNAADKVELLEKVVSFASYGRRRRQ
jgi:hypothetical protein